MTPTIRPKIRELEMALDRFLSGQKRPLATLLRMERKNHDFFQMLGEPHVSFVGAWSHWQFVRAASGGDEEFLAILISANLHHHASSEVGEGALSVVARHDWTEGIRQLLAAGCKLDTYNYAGYTPLHLAARDGAAAAVRLLLESGALKDAQTKDGDANTPLHCAAVCSDQVKAAATMEVLVAAGAAVDQTNAHSRTPRDLAALRRKLHSVVMLDDIVAKKGRGELPSITVIPMPAKHAHPSEKKLNEAFAALKLGVDAKMAKCLKSLEKAHSEAPSLTAGTVFPSWLMARFREIVAERNESLLQRLLQLGIMRWTYLFDRADTPLHMAAVVDWSWGIQQILEAGACTESLNASGESPLHIAIRARATRSVEILVKCTFSGGHETDAGDSVLHLLGQIDGPEAERICVILLAAGADPTAKNRAGTPVDESVLKVAASYSPGPTESR